MVSLLANVGTSFVLGLLTPLTAVCVLPLYPGFLAYLSNKLKGREENKRLPAIFGLLIVSGVILFMFLLGLLFTTILEISLNKVVGIVSPIAFGILIIISLLLIFDISIGRFLPKIRTPAFQNPLYGAFTFGFFFGAIVVPCNPAFIAALFVKTVAGTNFVANILSFLAFGIGIGFPLLFFALLSSAVSQHIIGFLTRNKRAINLGAGIVMLVISLYYLIFVFRVFG